MKKLLAVLAACLLLTACGRGGTGTEPSEETQPETVGLYNPESLVEQQTGGAVRAYPLDDSNYVGLASMGSKLLLIRDDGTMTVLAGDQCEIAAVLELGAVLPAYRTAFDTADTGAAYFSQDTNQVLRLNPQLQQSAVYDLPDNIQGMPAVSLGTREVYYFTGQELRALNMQSGVSRLIRNYDGEMTFAGMYFDGAVLACQTGDGQGGQKVLYISTQTGQTLSQDPQLIGLQTYGDSYFAMRQDGQITQRIFGLLDGQAQSLNLNEQAGRLTAALPLDGVISYVADESGLGISFYDLESGLRSAAVTLEGVGDPAVWHADQQYVWILAYENEKQVLYRWDISKSAVQEETVYTGPLFTYQSPDTEGLARCQSRVDTMNQAYGVRIHIWEDALGQTGGYTMTGEHQVVPINGLLDQLENVLAKFPEKFLQSTVEAGWVRICLVRSIDNEAGYVQYWAEGDCYIAVSLDADVQNAFLVGLGYAVDSHVVGNSRDFDTWNELNPQGFTYGQIQNTLLEGENRAFVDAESMQNPYEDRSRMIACAMMEGKEEVFSSEIMQKKLLRICMGIREAYGLEKSTQTYFWEQYLNQSLAYTK